MPLQIDFEQGEGEGRGKREEEEEEEKEGVTAYMHHPRTTVQCLKPVYTFRLYANRSQALSAIGTKNSFSWADKVR